jgi:cytochrome b pre-mRNA-processing protein 3
MKSMEFGMLSLFGKRAERKREARALYQRAATQALNPHFYARWGVPDTFDGRFEMLMLHAALVCRRLSLRGKDEAKLAQAFFDVMFRQMDRTLRERGVGDLGIPRHVKRMMRGFKGRATAYDAALRAANDPEMLRQALIRNVYGTVKAPSDIVLSQLFAYIKTCDIFPNLEAGQFPRPEDNDEESTGSGTDARVAA